MYDSWDHDTQISTAASMKVHHMSLVLVCFTSAPRNAGMTVAKVETTRREHQAGSGGSQYTRRNQGKREGYARGDSYGACTHCCTKSTFQNKN